MSNSKPYVHLNVYHNTMSGATPSAFMPDPDAIDEAFIDEASRVLSTAVELIRVLIDAHQSAVAIIVQRDWQAVHKFFSLSEKYATWADYRTAAVEIINNWLYSTL
jgi:hypothetical protein